MQDETKACAGKHIETLGRALGMEVLIAGRKGETLAPQGRIPFDDMLRRATVIILCLPRNPQTLNLLSTAEFAQMSPYAVVINVARGGIVDEAAVVHALKKGQIAGYAADVFDHEPVEGEGSTPLLSEEARGLNVTMTPHIAWFSQRTLANLGRILGDTVEAWMRGEPINVVC
jgi:phosphoglycerate dehydrogenase-like enzyme